MSSPSRDPNSESSGVSMDLMSLVRLVARHWRVTVPAGVLTFVMVVAAFVMSSPTYAASASVALFSPPQPPDAAAGTSPSDVGQNPFSRYGDLSVVADIVARKMDSDAEHLRLKAKGVSGYTVAANRLQRGPLVEVTGMGSTPEAAIGSAKLVIAEFETVLTGLQRDENADPDYLITSAAIEPPETATAQVGSTVRTAIAALAVGGLGTLGVAVLAEAFVRRRSVAQHSDNAPEEAHEARPPAGSPASPVTSPAAAARPPGAAAVAPTDGRRGTRRPPTGARPGRAPRADAATPRPEPADRRAPAAAATRTAGDRPDQEAGTRSDGRDGSQRRGRNGSAAPAGAERPPVKRDERTRWMPASGAGHENGHKQTTTDGGS